jgi:hypothetical protein
MNGGWVRGKVLGAWEIGADPLKISGPPTVEFACGIGPGIPCIGAVAMGGCGGENWAMGPGWNLASPANVLKGPMEGKGIEPTGGVDVAVNGGEGSSAGPKDKLGGGDDDADGGKKRPGGGTMASGKTSAILPRACRFLGDAQ